MKGYVTTPTVRMPASLDMRATTGAAPVPVPPPMPAVMKTCTRFLYILTTRLSTDGRCSKAVYAPCLRCQQRSSVHPRIPVLPARQVQDFHQFLQPYHHIHHNSSILVRKVQCLQLMCSEAAVSNASTLGQAQQRPYQDRVSTLIPFALCSLPVSFPKPEHPC